MKSIETDKDKVSMCGLYCGACSRFLKEKCRGCPDNEKASWCGVRTCCIEKQIGSCADCKDFANVKDCKTYNTFMSRIFGFIFRTDRSAGIDRIRQIGYDEFAGEMTVLKQAGIKRK